MADVKHNSFPFIRCPACGQWALLERLKSGIATGYTPERGRPGGRGNKWISQPLSDKARTIMSNLLRRAADHLEASVDDGSSEEHG